MTASVDSVAVGRVLSWGTPLSVSLEGFQPAEYSPVFFQWETSLKGELPPAVLYVHATVDDSGESTQGSLLLGKKAAVVWSNTVDGVHFIASGGLAVPESSESDTYVDGSGAKYSLEVLKAAVLSASNILEKSMCVNWSAPQP
jgi:hypothetical protein